MAEIQSQSDRSANSLKNFLVPSAPYLILLFLLSAILLVIYNSSQIISWFGNQYLESAPDLNSSLSVLSSGFNRSFDAAFGGRLGQIIIWSLVGALVYMFIWYCRNVLNSFENDVIIDHYNHPTNFNRGQYWSSSLAGIIFFIALTIITIAYTFIGLKVIIPAASALSSSSVYNWHLPQSPLYIALCLIIPAAAIYIWVLMVRVLSHLWKML